MRYIKSFQNDAAIQDAVDNKVLGKPYVALNESAGTIDWDSKDVGFAAQYLTIEALESGTFKINGAAVDYSVNGSAWQTSPSNNNCGWWLGGISTNGTLVKKPGYNWDVGPNQIYQYRIPATWSQVNAE